jgi:hypothetical protein
VIFPQIFLCFPQSNSDKFHQLIVEFHSAKTERWKRTARNIISERNFPLNSLHVKAGRKRFGMYPSTCTTVKPRLLCSHSKLRSKHQTLKKPKFLKMNTLRWLVNICSFF